MSGFTPGPWRVGKTFAPYARGDNDYPCAQIDLPPDEGEFDYHTGAIEIWSERHIANARLISAAPDGYELAEDFLAFAKSGADFSYPPGSLQKLEAFLAKVDAKLPVEGEIG